MPHYFEEHSNQNAAALPPRREEVNELFLASYHLATYGGCEFGCPYCDAWSYNKHPINENIRAFVDLPERLAKELPRIDSGDVIGLTLGDPYQPAEQVYRVTRRVLEVLIDHRHPCLVLTKSPSVLEDFAPLQALNRHSLAIVVMTVITIDNSLSNLLEPQVPTPAERVKTIAALQRAGIPCGFALIPIILFLTDDEEHLVRTLDTGDSATRFCALGLPVAPERTSPYTDDGSAARS
ncbi:radical SAM protein [Dehalococcoidia bacterium]|nr:radical SAM protein [Dehalococcoidia bacterium]